MAPDFLIIGAQKSASTFLHQCLCAHAQVFMPAREVTAYESPDYERGAPARLGAELAAAAGAPGVRLRGIKRPNLLGTPGAAQRVRLHAPGARLIAVLRNPAERAVSAYYHYMSDGFIPLRPVNEGLPAVLDGEYDTRWPRAREIVRFGQYAQCLQEWAPYLDRDRLLLVLQEDIARDARAVMARVAAYLDIPAQFPDSVFAARPQAVVYHLGRLRVLRWRNALRYRYNPARTRLELRRWNAPGRALAKAITAVDRMVGARVAPARRPQLDAPLLARLHALYASDVAAVERLTGRKLDHWMAPARVAEPRPAVPLTQPARAGV